MQTGEILKTVKENEDTAGTNTWQRGASLPVAGAGSDGVSAVDLQVLQR